MSVGRGVTHRWGGRARTDTEECPAGTAAGAQVSSPQVSFCCLDYIWPPLRTEENLCDSVTDMASDKRARLFALNQCHLD